MAALSAVLKRLCDRVEAPWTPLLDLAQLVQELGRVVLPRGACPSLGLDHDFVHLDLRLQLLRQRDHLLEGHQRRAGATEAAARLLQARVVLRLQLQELGPGRRTAVLSLAVLRRASEGGHRRPRRGLLLPRWRAGLVEVEPGLLQSRLLLMLVMVPIMAVLQMGPTSLKALAL